MDKLKIGYFADGPWSHRAFSKIIEDNSLDVKFIIPRIDTKDKTLFDFAEKYNIDYFSHKNINSTEFIHKITRYECDIFVSLSFNQIFKTTLINLPKYKTINVHAGKLPFYRGRNILNWALINDEKDFGITLHYVDEGIDTGDIIFQHILPITDVDDYSTLLNRAYDGCAEILYKGLIHIQQNHGVIQTIKQKEIHPLGFYCGGRQEGDEIINWNQTSRDIFNFIRAVSKPGPQAITTLHSSSVKINKSLMVENALQYKNTPGQVVGKTDHGILVKTADTVIEITEFESSGKIRIGDRFL